jgi:hypothetical protein
VDSIKLVASMSLETFSEMMAVSRRQVREILYSQLGIKAKSKSLLKNLQQKKEERVAALHDSLKKASSKRDADICAELIRNWLYTQRPLLKSALDFLGIPNEDGLIDSDPTMFAELPKEKTKSLFNHLCKDFSKERVAIYLAFMDTAHLDAVV